MVCNQDQRCSSLDFMETNFYEEIYNIEEIKKISYHPNKFSISLIYGDKVLFE